MLASLAKDELFVVCGAVEKLEKSVTDIYKNVWLSCKEM